MPTSYTANLKLSLPVQGELAGSWGDLVNQQITQFVEDAVAGAVTINSWTANSHTLTFVNAVTSEARYAVLNLTDTGVVLTGPGQLIVPNINKTYIVRNNTARDITVKTATGAGVVVKTGDLGQVLVDGTDVVTVAQPLEWANIQSTPTTLVGYGITDAATSAQGTNADTAYGWGDHASGGYALDANVPSNTGAGASGTWDIGITGEAARAKGLSRSDSASDTYNCQFRWQYDKSGYWTLAGFNGNTFHADCWVGWAGNADNADNADNVTGISRDVGNYGSISCNTTRGGFYGLSCNGHLVLMSNGTSHGIFDDVNNEWWVRFYENAGVTLNYNAAAKVATTSAGATVTGALTATSNVTAYSDERLKENVKTLDPTKVLQMRGVEFDRIDTGEHGSGVIAQELERLAPELVITNEDGIKSVAYGNIVGYLIEAIKEQQIQIEALKEQLNGLTR